MVQQSVQFVVVNQYTEKLTGLHGEIRFHENGKLVHIQPFKVPPVDAKSEITMEISTPESLAGDYKYSGHITTGLAD